MESAERRMIRFQSPLPNLRVPFCLQRALDASPILAGLESFATMHSFLCIFILTQHWHIDVCQNRCHLNYDS